MKYKTLSIFLAAGWLLTASAFGYMLTVGDTSGVDPDNRQMVNLTPSERDLVLTEMRGLLVALQGVLSEMNQENYLKAADIAESAGMVLARETGGEHPAIVRKLPAPMKRLGFSVHADFDGLAAMLRKPRPDRKQIMSNLAGTLNKCVSCHGAYRLSTVAGR